MIGLRDRFKIDEKLLDTPPRTGAVLAPPFLGAAVKNRGLRREPVTGKKNCQSYVQICSFFQLFLIT